MENQKGFPHRKKAMENPRVSHSATATTNRHAAQAPPPPPPTVAPYGAAAFLLSIQQNTTEYNGKDRKTDAKSPIRARKTTFSAEKTARMYSKRRKTESARGHHARRGSQGKKDEPRQIQPFFLPNRAARRQATDHKKAPWNPYGKREKREARRHLILLETIETFFTAGIDRKRISGKNIFQCFNCLQIIH